MPSFSAFLAKLFKPGHPSILTEREFAEVYLKALREEYPTVNFTLNPDLVIISKKDDMEYKQYIDNAFVAYKAEPDSIDDIINRFVEAAASLYQESEEIDLNNVVPLVRTNDFVKELIKDNGGKSFLLSRKYNDELVIVYAEDSEHSVRYLGEDDLKSLSVSIDILNTIAVENLGRILSEIQTHGENGLYMLTAGGTYEASLILMTTLWTSGNFPIDGELIVAIPNRDLLLITGSEDEEGMSKIREIAAESYNTGNYRLSEYLYRWTGAKFEKYS
ncbi:DUF1444 family protein [Chitinophaga tropicalis]|uniref:DUF1444 family protein n=1 Tax=Chitinophaga tropicalis TaxID=2683588 RepID=A0A7K1U571_9BACT|nr:DUF1444 family protein [Chitinophaga tropicalis]MVT09490.1 DUF1444 family protein [Chitinophaga tropicalis]